MQAATRRILSRAQVGAVLTPLAALVLSLVPLPLEGEARRLVPIVGAVLVAWVTEVVPIPVTALLIAPAMVVAGVCDARQAFAPYASPILFIFVGGFMIARAMTRHGLDRRIALGVLSLGPVGKSAARTRAALMLTGVVLSMWISNTATTAILLPILLGTLPPARDAEGERHTTGSILAVAYACSVGGLGTLVGSPPNLITVRMLQDADVRLSFLDWMVVGLPAALLFVALIFVSLHLIYRPTPLPVGTLPKRDDLPPWSRGERVTALAFGLAAFGWMLPGVAAALDHPAAPTLAALLPPGVVALLAASVLFMVPDRGGEARVLPWPEAARIDWGLILLFGGGISMGSQMFDTGLADALGRGFIELTGVRELWTLVALTSLFTLFFTEMCSNTATANMLAPLVIGVARELGVSPIPPALAVGLSASCAFMLPVATGPNAIAYATGQVPLPRMLRTGAGLNLLCCAAIVLWLWILCPAMGWT